jgi:hypothetical protein
MAITGAGLLTWHFVGDGCAWTSGSAVMFAETRHANDGRSPSASRY